MQNPINTGRYNEERAERWTMAQDGEETAIKEIVAILKRKLGNHLQEISYYRYDDIVHGYFPPDENEWAKGCSDYYIKAVIRDNNKTKFILFEIKLKAEEFRLTKNGGDTRNGSQITKYNCQSYYLDIVPVLRNMNKFCEMNNIDKLSFIVAFVPIKDEDDPNHDDSIMVASLWRINYILENGWYYLDGDKRIDFKICKYGEGYGKTTYLIPKSATTNLLDISVESFLNRLNITDTLPFI